jgi:4-carboxymuconolactone decarboxylase
MTLNRYEIGLKVLQQVGGVAYDDPLRVLETIAPDLARFTVEFGYGDIMARPALDLKTRQLATVAALTALANAAPQLRFHIEGALNVGWKPLEVVEVIMLSTVYAGFPAALNGVLAAKEVFERRGLMPDVAASASSNDRHERGLSSLQAVSGNSGAGVVQALAQIAPDLGRFIVDFSYGEVISRPTSTIGRKNLPLWRS